MVRTELTLDDLEQMPDDAMHRELIDGELIELPPAEDKHTIIALNLYDSLQFFVKSRRLGRSYHEGGYRVTTDRRNWIQPDVSFVNRERLGREAGNKYLTGAPDLAVEVISPSERPKDILAKRNVLFQNGCKEIWIVRPKTQNIEIWTNPRKMDRELHKEETLSSLLFDGWSMPVADVFITE
jgi:Uma2 family endonuclease